jgi:hypothetical protein
MSKSKSRKKRPAKRVLALPDLDHAREARDLRVPAVWRYAASAVEPAAIYCSACWSLGESRQREHGTD